MNSVYRNSVLYRILSLHLTILFVSRCSEKNSELRYELRILTYSCNSEFVARSSDFISQF